jgi:predicted HAD superfamily hydrolase
MNAEREARRVCINENNEEIIINDIYDFCDFSSITNTNKTIIMQTELDIEEEVLLPVEKIRKEIDQYVKLGIPVIYLSDMYLSKDFIEKTLIKKGFYVNHNIFVSSEIKKTKSTGHLYNHIEKELHFEKRYWLHSGDNTIVDYKIPRHLGIKAKLVNNSYNLYEMIGKRFLTNGTNSLSGYVFDLSRAIRLSLQDTPTTLFASTFVAPMFVSFVYEIMCESKKRGINHLFFVARDGYILYQIAKEMENHFPTIKLSYLYASRQALYMAGLMDISPEHIKIAMPHLEQKNIEGILYELHLPSFDYSHLSISDKNGMQIIDILFSDKPFVKAFTQKYKEQNNYIIKYFEQEGLSNGNCAIVDVVGSRRCQAAINNILARNNYPKVFAYYFEVTWCRITNFEPYLSANYQEIVINSPFYNRASQPLYEQFFAITNQKRTVEYQYCGDKIVPVFENDFISEKYKQEVYETNRDVCLNYAKHYIGECHNKMPIAAIQAAQKAFAVFCHIPRKEFLKALESFRCTGSGEANEILLNKKSLIYVIFHINQFFRWPEGQLIYSSGWLYPLIRYMLKMRFLKKWMLFPYKQ